MYLYKAIKYNIFKIISLSAIEMQQTAFVFGDYVLNYLIGKKKNRYINIVSSGSVIHLAQHVTKYIKFNSIIHISNDFSHASIKISDKNIEFVNVSQTKKIIDFTINSMAISLNKFDYGRLIDHYGGLDDLKKKTIRTPKDPNKTFSEDPLCMLRAIRFASKLHFIIEKKAFIAIKNNIERIRTINIKRIMNELQKIIIYDKPSWGLNLLMKSGLLSLILPEVTNLYGIKIRKWYTHKDNYFHTLEVVDNVSNYSSYIWLRWSALLHDIGKDVTKKFKHKIGWTFHGHEFIGAKMITNIFKRLKLNLPTGEIIKYIQKIIKYSSRPISLISDKATDSALRRLLWQIGNSLEDLIILCKSDITTKNILKKNTFRKNFIQVEKKIKNLELRDRIRNWKSVISGYEIMNIFDLQPSPIIGIIKKYIKNSVLEGKLVNDFKSVYCYIIKIGQELGLHPKTISLYD